MGGVGVWSVQSAQVILVGCGQYEPGVRGEVGRGGLRPRGQVGALLVTSEGQVTPRSCLAHVVHAGTLHVLHSPLPLLPVLQSAAWGLRGEPHVPHEALPPPPRPQGNVDRRITAA